MLITLEFKNVKVTVEGELYIDGESTEIVVTDPCIDGKFELSYTTKYPPFRKMNDDILMEVGKMLHDGYTNREISDVMELSVSCINNVRKCVSPRYADLKFVVDGWPSVKELRKMKENEVD